MYVEESEEFAVFNCVNLICFAALFSYYSVYNPLKRSPLFDNHESFRSGKIHLVLLHKDTEQNQILIYVGGAREGEPTCKIKTFFVRSLTLTEPIFNNFQKMDFWEKFSNFGY